MSRRFRNALVFFITLTVTTVLRGQTPAVKARDLFLETAARTKTVAATHLALRYNLIQIEPATREARSVDADSNFKNGDCFAVEFTPNRDGEVLLSTPGENGALELLLPSAKMPEELTSVKAGQPVRFPKEYCLAIGGKPGVETLLVAVTGRKDDVQQLRAANTGQIVETLKEWRQQLKGRDIIFEKTGAIAAVGSKNDASKEKPYSVYFADGSTDQKDRMVIEVKIRHE